MKLSGLTFAALCKREVLCGVKPNATSSTKHKRADLQGLRGVAILFVLVMHLKPNSYRLGFVGVDIFFVLSGFLMAKILLERKLTLWSVWYFYSRRFKRIVPLYMLFVVSVYIYGYFYVLRFDRRQILDDLTWAYTYSSNLQPIYQKLGYWDQLSTYRFFVHAWSLGVELQYYLIVPFIMGIALCFGHSARIIIFLSIGVLSFLFQLYAPPKISYGFLLSRVWQFMCGSLAYELSKPASSFAKDKPLLPQEGEGSPRKARKQDKINLSYDGLAIVLLATLTLSVAIHHTLEKFFEKSGVIPACLCVIACYACILCTKSMYIYSPPLESIDPNISKIGYAIEWNLRESRKVYFAMPCSKDVDTQRYTNYKKWPQMRCVAKGNATARVLMLGNSIAYIAYPLIHNILKRRYHSLRLYSRSACPPLSNWCPDFTKAMRKVVQHEKPDIILYMHLSVYAPFVAPVKDLKKDRIYKEFQENIDFISKYTKHIVIDMPYYKPSFNTGAKLARRLQLGLSPGDEFVVTWKQHINQTRYHQLRLKSLNCSKCIMNEINEALFKDGLFRLYDQDTLLARIGDGIHMTPVGLELLRPLYTKIMENLLQTLTS